MGVPASDEGRPDGAEHVEDDGQTFLRVSLSIIVLLRVHGPDDGQNEGPLRSQLALLVECPYFLYFY